MTTTSAPYTEAVCVFCGGPPRKIHADTGRCQTCGRVAMSAPADRASATNGHTPSNGVATSNAKTEPFKLPSSRATRSFIEHARALREGFLKAAAEAEHQEQASHAEAVRYRRAAAVFTQLLEQVDVESEEHAGATGKWSKNFDACVDCRRSSVRHVANGRCAKCDTKWRSQQKGSRS